ncbi:hypothetical protein P167DRAFT_116312 [Morchella conica CCBAS932]|uniref:DUF7708 domain-containing protein n=1 Tax=Morchella conica CCBAS932 TaxID=1392247 RepID=A0A3N4K7X9_9PEZI|nr:hypothetical protein P167DRAFT_116312 [Morchella conica CCBAS932]
MGCICSKCCPTSGEENGADNARVSEQKPSSRRNKQNTVVSTGYPLNVNPGQPSKNQSTHTEDSITSSDTSIPPVADYAGTAPYPANSVAGHTVFEARPLDTQRSENLTPPSDVTPDQPEKNLFTLTESSMTASDTSTSPPTNQVAILTTYIPDIMTGPTVAESQPPEVETEKRSSVLWEKAFTKIREPNNGHSGDETFPKGSLVENIINDLKERKEQCDDKRWFIIKDDRKVFIVDNLLVQLNKYAAIGDIALQHNPDVVALVWAGFRGLLQAGIAYVNLMRSVSESLDYLVELLCCCDIYEKLYCNTKFGISEDLNKCFVNLYASILKYLRKMSIYLNHNTGGRIIKSFSQEIQDLLNDIKSKQQELKEKIDVAEKEASASNRFDQDKNIKKLRGLLIEIQEPIAETLHVVEIIYNEVRNDRRLKILTWLSEVEYESHHLLSVQRRLHGTGYWLQENGHFIRWRESETNPILWLRADGKMQISTSGIGLF